jgi:hypothetical protein
MLVAAGLIVVGCGDDSEDSDDDALEDRQAEVAERGAEVMPFDLDATMHQFGPAEDGTVQTVVALDPDDEEQVTLIREHLEEEAARFSEGDYNDPAAIHGEDMAGLAELSAGADAIAVAADDLPSGGRITFSTDDPDLVDALRRWAEAQTEDHGDHAEHVD